MKTISTLIACIALCVAGCSTPQKQMTCDTALAAWTAYQSAIADGFTVDPDVAAAARVGAAFLSSYCGWYAPKTRGLSGDPIKDQYGVLVIYPPKQ